MHVPNHSSWQFYQSLIDRGWRRSGDFVYQYVDNLGLADVSPDMARTCCPQYTIRLDVTAFKPTKKHRQVINRFNRYLVEGAKPGGSSMAPDPVVNGGKGKGKAPEWELMAELKKHEEGWGTLGQHHNYAVSWNICRY